MNPDVQQNVDSQVSEEEEGSYKNDFLQDRFTDVLERHPDLSADQAFYLEYCKLYIDTVKVEQEIQKAIAEIQKLRGITDKHPCKVKKNISQHLHNDTSNSERRKRVRRTANEIARHYVCKVEKCQKSYGSEGSLNQHMKIKHHDLVDQMTGLMMDK